MKISEPRIEYCRSIRTHHKNQKRIYTENQTHIRNMQRNHKTDTKETYSWHGFQKHNSWPLITTRLFRNAAISIACASGTRHKKTIATRMNIQPWPPIVCSTIPRATCIRQCNSNRQCRYLQVGGTIMLPNAIMQTPMKMWQACIIQWLQQNTRVRRL